MNHIPDLVFVKAEKHRWVLLNNAFCQALGNKREALIGSYCGKSAVYLGSACRENGAVLFSIDHHRGFDEQQPGEEYFDPALFDFNTFAMNTLPLFRETLALAGLEETVVPVVSRSDIVVRSWETKLALVFIDGGHAFETARTGYDC